MLELQAEGVCVEFPVYDRFSRSLRHQFVLNKVMRPFSRRNEDGGAVGGAIETGRSGKLVVKALDNISFSVREGDRVGMLGRNGAGKTTLLRTIAGIYEPVLGRIRVNGTVTPMFNINDGMDMDSTGLENIRLRGRLLGLPTQVITSCVDEIVEFTELGDYLYMPVRTYSSGMMVRLSFAIATTVMPEILVMDEMIGAGDAAFLDKAQERLKKFIGRSGILVIASHNPGILKQWCNLAMLLENGRLVAFGPVDEVIERYNGAPASH